MPVIFELGVIFRQDTFSAAGAGYLSYPVNHLAHLILAPNTPAARIGQLLGDFVHGRPDILRQSLPDEVVDAIVHHRAIDQWTDQHPLIYRARQWIAPSRGRFRGVIIDILCDHFLTLEWNRYSCEPLRDFLDHFYQELESHRHWLPSSLADDLSERIARDWLGHYGDDSGLTKVFVRTARRHPKFAPLTTALDDLHAHRAALHAMFLEFFPQLAAWSRNSSAS